MFHVLKRIAAVPHALYAIALQALIVAVAGLIQHNILLVRSGVAVFAAVLLLRVAVRAAVLLGARRLKGQFVAVQQPQLTDVRAHMHRTKELSQVA